VAERGWHRGRARGRAQEQWRAGGRAERRSRGGQPPTQPLLSAAAAAAAAVATRGRGGAGGGSSTSVERRRLGGSVRGRVGFSEGGWTRRRRTARRGEARRRVPSTPVTVQRTQTHTSTRLHVHAAVAAVSFWTVLSLLGLRNCPTAIQGLGIWKDLNAANRSNSLLLVFACCDLSI
jgi:hypothetical protein